MAISEETIPILDFRDYNIYVDKNSVSDKVLGRLATEFITKFDKIGFCNIINHGISDEFLQEYTSVTERFFHLPVEEKKVYERTKTGGYHGWVGIGGEVFDSNTPGDLKESFNFCQGQAPEACLLNMSEFNDVNQKMFAKCHELGNRLCEVLAIGFGLDRNYFLDTHKFVGQPENGTTLRSLYFPPVTNFQLEPGQVRWGEHSDFGTISIHFEDDIGGLEVKSQIKGFIPATPIHGAALVNIGDAMHRWTADRLMATKYRVRIPETEQELKRSRRSVAFFMVPDNDVIIECWDGSHKYEPIRFVDYLNSRMNQIILKE